MAFPDPTELRKVRGDIEAAEKCFKEIVAFIENGNTTISEERVEALHQAGNYCLIVKQDDILAKSYLGEAAFSMDILYGESDPKYIEHLADIEGKLSQICFRLQAHDEHRQHVERKLELLIKLHGPNHTGLLPALKSLKRYAFENREYSNLLKYRTMLLRLQIKNRLVTDKYEFAQDLEQIAFLCSLLGKHRTSVRLYKCALKIFEQAGRGRFNLIYCSCACGLANAYTAAKKYDKAEQLYQEVEGQLVDYSAIHDADKDLDSVPQVLSRVLYGYSGLLKDTGRIEEASRKMYLALQYSKQW